MQERILNLQILEQFQEHLTREEKSKNTLEKYLRDTRRFFLYTEEKGITKETVISYKTGLLEAGYTVSSINSILASLNSLFTFLEWTELKVKFIKIQRQVYAPENKELTKAEYLRLIQTAKEEKKERLSLILQTICSTGIRISELPFITVEAMKKGKVTVFIKGKTREVFLVSELRKKLLCYAAKIGRKNGSLFVTQNGNPVNRTNIWREMKNLCKKAGVSPKKVFPHNLRHLFARTFYQLEKDIAKLADLLGHSSIETTRIYIMTTGKEHRKRLEKMQLII